MSRLAARSSTLFHALEALGFSVDLIEVSERLLIQQMRFKEGRIAQQTRAEVRAEVWAHRRIPWREDVLSELNRDLYEQRIAGWIVVAVRGTGVDELRLTLVLPDAEVAP